MKECKKNTANSKENMTFFIGEECASGIWCNTWEEFVEYLHDAYLERMEKGKTQFNVTIENSVAPVKKAVVFDEFARNCKFFDPASDVNNGYGCKNPFQEEVQTDKNGVSRGCCYCFSCPLGIEADECDRNSPEYSRNIDWDGLCEDGEVAEGEYLLVEIAAPDDDEKEALERYEKYLHRYDAKPEKGE